MNFYTVAVILSLVVLCAIVGLMWLSLKGKDKQ